MLPEQVINPEIHLWLTITEIGKYNNGQNNYISSQ